MRPLRSSQLPDFGTFLDELHGKSVGIVYSYSNTIDRRRAWYDRWRSKVIMYFGQGAEALGLDVRYLDVDTYLSEMAAEEKSRNEFVLNLHSGLNDISSWPIISSFASWRGAPVGFCPSDVHITCERKDVTRALALQLAMKLPAQWHDEAEPGRPYIIKERDLGRSVGLRKTSDTAELHSAHKKDNLIVEEFIPGFDATVAVLANHSGGYTVIGARSCLPKGPNKLEWMFTEERKGLPYDNDDYSTEKISVGEDITGELLTLSRMLGDGSVYRYDFRVEPTDDGRIPPEMTLDNSWFLEVTPTPAISQSNDFGSIMSDVANDVAILGDLTGKASARFDGEHAPQSILVACILYKSIHALRTPYR